VVMVPGQLYLVYKETNLFRIQWYHEEDG